MSDLLPWVDVVIDVYCSGRGEDGGQNPGNNLHVSGLSTKVDTRDLEAAFTKVGRVSTSAVLVQRPCTDSMCRSKRLRSCMIRTRVSRVDLGL